MPVPTHDHIDWADRLVHLRMADTLDADALTPVARRLVDGLPQAAVIVDVGCGAGGMSKLFANELARRGGGTIVLVDATPALLAEAQRAVVAKGVEVRAVAGDLADVALPESVPEADLVWASGVVHHVADQQAALATLGAALKPGGVLAIAEGGLEMRCLPWDLGVGRPGLERRLAAAREEWFAAMRAGIPGTIRMPYGWPVALRRAGLEDIETFAALIDHPLPGSALLRDYVVSHIGWLAKVAQDWLAAEDREVLTALLDPESEDFLGVREDLYLLGAKTIHCGRRR